MITCHICTSICYCISSIKLYLYNCLSKFKSTMKNTHLLQDVFFELNLEEANALQRILNANAMFVLIFNACTFKQIPHGSSKYTCMGPYRFRNIWFVVPLCLQLDTISIDV